MGLKPWVNEDPIKLLIKKLREQSFSNSKWERFLSIFKSPAKTSVQPGQIIVQNWLNSMFENLITCDNKLKLDGNCSLLLTAFYECQGEISSEIRERLIMHAVILTDIMFHHDIRNAMYLFTKLNVTNISKIDIRNISKKKYPKNMVDLLTLYLQTKTSKILHLKGGYGMRLYSNETDEAISIELDYDDNNVDTHNEFLLSAISLVNTIELNCSLDNMYPFVRELLKANKITKTVIYNIPTVATTHQLKMLNDSILMGQRGDKSNINVNFTFIPFTDEHFKTLQPCIPYLENLAFCYLEVPSLFMNHISDTIMKITEINNTCNLKLINLCQCNLTDEHIKILQPCIPYLENFVVSRNWKMSSQAMKYISDSILKAIEINNTCNLKVINLGTCGLTDEHIKLLQPCIPYLENLDISLNLKMSSQAMRYISDSIMKAIEINTTCNLKVINLRHCDLTDEHIKLLQPCIPYLENLDVSYNLSLSDEVNTLVDNLLSKELK